MDEGNAAEIGRSQRKFFDLHVTVNGLCLLAPQEGETPALHVLMPTTPVLGPPPPGNGGRPVPVPLHVPVLSFKPRYLSRDSGADGAMDVEYDLRGLYLDLSQLKAGGKHVGIPGDKKVAPLSDVTGQTIPPAQAGPTPDASVAARVTLPKWNEVTPSGGSKWNWGARRDLNLTNEVKLVIRDVRGDSLSWSLAGLHGAPGQALPPLYPHPGEDGRPALHLGVTHLTFTEDMSIPEPGAPDEHFAAYYSVFKPPLGPGTPLPEYESGGVGSFFFCLLSLSLIG